MDEYYSDIIALSVFKILISYLYYPGDIENLILAFYYHNSKN